MLALLGACASVPPNAGNNPADPFERVNRQVYAFNDTFDRAVAKPVAKGYTYVVPKPVRECVGNVFANIGEVGNIINAALQGKPGAAACDVGRLVVNTTVGIAGCFDVAKYLGCERNRQDFGLTMGKWGLSPGPYVVLPFLGPSSVRDALGEIPDYFTDPVSYIKPVKDSYFVYTGRFIDRRAQLLDVSNLVEDAALDPYQFVRDGYLQRRRSRVYDGNPPPLPDEEDPDSPAPDASSAGGAVRSPAPSPEAAPAAGVQPQEPPAPPGAAPAR